MAKYNKENIQLETFLREKIREIVAEEIISLSEMIGDEPRHGQQAVDDSGHPVYWNAPEQKWVDADTWDAHPGNVEPEIYGPEDPDPELSMDPEDRKRMIDSLLNMEFEENKQVHMEHLTKMIRESVRRTLTSKK